MATSFVVNLIADALRRWILILRATLNGMGVVAYLVSGVDSCAIGLSKDVEQLMWLDLYISK